MENKYIKKIVIGNIEIKNNVFLAPMAGITDLAFRYICSKYGVGMAITEMVSAKGLIYQDKKTHKIMDMYDGEFPKIVQIFGSDIEVLTEVVKRLNDNPNVDIIDFNLGCPAPKVVKNGDGSKLLEDLEKVEEIIKSITKVAKKPITVKTRLGYSKNKLTVLDVASICQKYGVAAITVHGRYKEEYFAGKVNLDEIKKVKEKVQIPVIASGDICSIESAKNMFEYTGVDAIMIGRAALGNPWIFEEILTGEKRNISDEERFKVIKEHIELSCSRESESIAIPKLRKHLAWYLKGLPESSEIKSKLNTQKDKEGVIKILEDFFTK